MPNTNPTIRIRRSAVPGKIPTTDQLQLGEFGLNTWDGKLFLEQDQGGVGVGTTIITVNPWNVGLGSNAYDINFTAGNVGIGTTIPTSKLTVIGDGYFTGIVTSSDGRLISGVGVQSGGIVIGTGVTQINFLGVGNTVSITGSTANITLTGVAVTQTPGRVITSYTTTAGLSTYNVVYSVGYLDVYLNGSRLNGSEFTASNGSTVVLESPPSEGDVLDLVFYTLGIGNTGPQGDPAPWVTTGVGIHTLSNVGIGTTNPAYKLDVGGDINSSTDIKIDGVSVLTTAQNDAVALAIALG